MRKQILLAFCLSLALQLFGQENAYEQYTFSPAYGTYTGCNDECITCTRIDYNTNTRITGGTEAYTSGILQSKVTWIGEDGSVIFTIRKCSGNFVQGNSGKIFVVDLHEGHVEYTGFYISDNSTNTLTVAYNAAWSGYSNKVFEIYYITSNQVNKIFAGCHTVRRLHQYSVSTSTNPANVASTSGDGQYTENSTCTVRAYDNNYYSFNYWKKDGSIASYNSTYSFTVTGNHSLVAYYNLRSYNVTASATEGGSASGSGSYNAGGTATLTATPNCGYRFVRWTDSYGNEVSTNTNYSFTVAGDATYTAEFEAVERVKINGLWYTINCSAGTARVAYETSTFPYYITCPTGDIVVPSSISYGGNSYTVEGIDSYAFYRCTGITSVTIPSSVLVIGWSAFDGCTSLTSVHIPSSVSSIADYAFSNCTSLESITVESGNPMYDSRDNCNAIVQTSINQLIFGCKNSTIPNTIAKIRGYAFSNCPGLTTVTIPNSVTLIGGQAFERCTGLTTVTIGESVTRLGNSVFYGCSNLTSITSLAEVCPTTGTNVFDNVPTNIPVYVPCGSVSSYQSVDGWSDFTNIQEVAGCSHTVTAVANDDTYGIVTGGGSYSDGATVTLTATPNCGYRFVQWNDGNTDNPRTVTVTADTTLTAQFAAVPITGIELVCSTGQTLVYSINCNSNTAALTGYIGTPAGALEIPSSISYYGRSYDVTRIDGQAFLYCNGLTSLYIPASVNEIGNYAFLGCGHLETIVVSANNTVFDSRNNCNALIHTESNTLLVGCSNTVIPNDVVKLDYGAFMSSTLRSIVIPNSVVVVDRYVFSGCDNLTSIVVADGNPVFDSRDNCNAVIQTSTNTLVSGCSNTTIPNTVTTIGMSAFAFCNAMTTVTIPSSVTYIAAEGFRECRNLTSITCLTTTPPTLVQESFYQSPMNIPVYVPCGTVASYQAAEWWSDFTYIQETAGCIHTVTVSANDASYGTVTGSGSYAIGETATLTATSNIGYAFVQWNDGNTDNPRQVVVTSDTMLVAMFEARTHYVQLIYSQGMTVRTIEGSTTVPHGGSVTLEAVTDDCHHFTRWDDNSTNPVRRIENVVSDTTVVAYGESYRYTVNATGSTGGTVTSDYDSQVNCGTTVTFTATADGGYTFVRWSDNNTDNPRQITVTDNITLTAIFAATRFNVTVTANNSSWGSVTGSGEYNDGATATLTATANNGYSFVRWDDGNTDNPRSIVVVSDTVLTALFTHPGTTYNIRTCNGQTLLFAVENINHTATVIGYVGLCAGNLIVPAWFSVDDERYTVTAIGPRAFENCTGLVSVTLPITITLVDEEAFKGCTGLIEVDMK